MWSVLFDELCGKRYHFHMHWSEWAETCELVVLHRLSFSPEREREHFFDRSKRQTHTQSLRREETFFFPSPTHTSTNERAKVFWGLAPQRRELNFLFPVLFLIPQMVTSSFVPLCVCFCVCRLLLLAHSSEYIKHGRNMRSLHSIHSNVPAFNLLHCVMCTELHFDSFIRHMHIKWIV